MRNDTSFPLNSITFFIFMTSIGLVFRKISFLQCFDAVKNFVQCELVELN